MSFHWKNGWEVFTLDKISHDIYEVFKVKKLKMCCPVIVCLAQALLFINVHNKL